MAYNFETDSGAGDTAFQTGHVLQGRFSSPGEIFSDVGYLINVVLGLLGIVFFGLIFYGGWLWMTAQGEEAQVGKAKKIIIAAIVGLVIVLSAYAISFLVISTLSSPSLN